MRLPSHRNCSDNFPQSRLSTAAGIRISGKRRSGRLPEAPAVRQCCRVAVENGRFAGYLITVEGRGEWNVREIGAIEGDARRMAVILRLGAHEARRSGSRHFYGWLPPDVVALLDDWPLKSRLRSKAQPMIRLFDETVDPGRLGTVRAAYMPYQDQF